MYEGEQSAVGQQNLKSAPTEAIFLWRRGDEGIWSLDVTSKELNECISCLEREGVSAPSEFRTAAHRILGQ